MKNRTAKLARQSTRIAACAAVLAAPHDLIHGEKSGHPAEVIVVQERAFAAACKEYGVASGFLKFLADSSIVLLPEPANGIEVYSQPPPPGDSSMLVWTPAKAEISASGDFGYSTGPWWFYLNPRDTAPKVSGHYNSVWKKQDDGEWKVVIDAGVSHEVLPVSTPQPRYVGASEIAPSASTTGDRTAIIASLHTLDSSAHQNAGGDNTLALAAGDIRVNRSRHIPAEGRSDAEKLLATVPGQFTRVPLGGNVSAASDLAYTYGKITSTQPTDSTSTAGGYMRVWRREHGADWHIVIDLLIPLRLPDTSSPSN